MTLRHAGQTVSAALAVVLPAYSAAQPDPHQAAVLTDKAAYLLMPAEFVAGPGVDSAEWSSSGQYVMATRKTMRVTPDILQSVANRMAPKQPVGEVAIVLWSARERKTREIWRMSLERGSVQSCRWLAGSDVALALVRELAADSSVPGSAPVIGRDTVLRIDASTGVRQTIRVTEGTSSFESGLSISCSPTAPLAVIRTHAAVSGRQGVREALQVVRPTGAVGPPFVLTEQIHYSPTDAWVGDGTLVQLYGFERTKNTVARRYYTYDPRSNTLAESATQPKEFRPVRKPGDLSVQNGTATIREQETTRPLKTLWLTSLVPSARPRALIHADGTLGVLSPRGDAVLYVAGGSAWVAAILRMPKEQYLAMMAASDRDTALANAKQIGLALRMYAGDYDDTLPAGDDVNAKIDPYLKSSDLLTGFIYNYGGGPLKGIGNPSETELGYVNGPGGHATIFADGHVVWRGD